MMSDLQKYLNIRQAIVNAGGDNRNADDVKDAFVDVSMDKVHLTDEDLTNLIIGYRTFETAYPEYVQRGNALIA
jgi:hypothetical protein